VSRLPLSNDFKSIVLNRTPLIDVRAPVEFANGAFPNAVNLPLINDEERHLIGICYKEEGNTEAVKLGHRLVSGEIRDERIQAWTDFISSHPDAKLYCFRGGQRSKISQEWISETGREITRLKGGYKAFRNYLLEQIETSPTRFSPIVLGGRTGSGKTILLKKLHNAIDLEGLANHRGSSFGRKVTAQPTQINFENALAYELIEKLEQGCRELVFEDEGKNVGTLYIPKSLAAYLAQAPRVILETPTHERVETTFDEYVTQAQMMYAEAGYEEPLQEWSKDIRLAMERIMKRIGSERYTKVCALFENALREQSEKGLLESYKEWAQYLLEEYYDPMYDYQIEKRAEQIVFRGSAEEILHYFSKA
jgi:tRNA 2-selenouridine synthase